MRPIMGTANYGQAIVSEANEVAFGPQKSVFSG